MNSSDSDIEYRTFSLLLDRAFAGHSEEELLVQRDGERINTKAILMLHDDGDYTQVVIRGRQEDVVKALMICIATNHDFTLAVCAAMERMRGIATKILIDKLLSGGR